MVLMKISKEIDAWCYFNVTRMCRELVIFHRMVNNAHVARLLGVVSSSPYYAVYELPVNGDLKMFLVSLKNSNTQ